MFAVLATCFPGCEAETTERGITTDIGSSGQDVSGGSSPTREFITEAFYPGWTIVEEPGGDVLVTGPANGLDLGLQYGPVLGFARFGRDGGEPTTGHLDIGHSVFVYEAIPHPDGGFVVAGISNNGTLAQHAWIARVDLGPSPTIHWQQFFGTGIEHQDQGFFGLGRSDGGFVAAGFGGESYGEQRPAVAAVTTDGASTGLGILLQGVPKGVGTFNAVHRCEDATNPAPVAVGFMGTRQDDGAVVGVPLVLDYGRATAVPVTLPGLGYGFMDVRVGPTGDLFVIGDIAREGDPNENDVLVARLDRVTLEPVWSRRLRDAGYEVAIALDLHPSGKVLAAWGAGRAGGDATFATVFDFDGNELDQQVFEQRWVQAAALSSDGTRFYLAGAARGPDAADIAEPGWFAVSEIR
jgi:hypothetical protein